jgi:hypothetical protein
VSPGSGEIIGRAGIAADLGAHIPTAPGGWAAGIAIVTAAGVVITMMMVAVVMI